MLIHSCNDEGVWGSFGGSISKRWKKPEEQYKVWNRAQILDRVKFQLGEIQIVDIQTDLSVVNMVCEKGTAYQTVETDDGKKIIVPMRCDSMKSCLDKVAKEAKERQASVHMAKFSSGLAGVEWTTIESLIKECLIDKGLNVTIYEFEEKK